MHTQEFLLYQKQAKVFKAIGHPLRVAILDYLKAGPRCVCQIAEYLGSERSNVSRHLAVMIGAGVLSSRKQGLNVFYEIRAGCLVHALACVHKLLEEQIRQDVVVIGQTGRPQLQESNT